MTSVSMQEIFTFESPDLFYTLCGIQDRRVPELEGMLNVELIPRGQSFLIRSPARHPLERALLFFEQVVRAQSRRSLDAFDTRYLHHLFEATGETESTVDEGPLKGGPADETGTSQDQPGEIGTVRENPPLPGMGEDSVQQWINRDKVFTTYRGKPLYAKTINQARYVDALFRSPVTIALGPAGTGKTFLAVIMACRLLTAGEIERIILTRPAVEAGENLGFLPGDMIQKVDPYLRPIYDALYECLSMEKVTALIQAGRIEIAPLAFMRGRTLNDAFVVLDEAQNCTRAQLKMFLTRLGRNARMALGGDVTQVDLRPGRSGLLGVASLLRNVEGVQIVRFGNEDIIRNPVVERMLRAFDREESRERGHGAGAGNETSDSTG